MADRAHLRALADTATELRAALRYGRPPEQGASLTYAERRARSTTPGLWPEFVAPEPR
jgi:hypothetical protein